MGSLFAKTTAKGRVLGCDGRLRLRWRERLCGTGSGGGDLLR
jgi:hypothetical protein